MLRKRQPKGHRIYCSQTKMYLDGFDPMTPEVYEWTDNPVTAWRLYEPTADQHLALLRERHPDQTFLKVE